MTRDFHHVGRNVDLDKLAERIEGFLTIDGFTEIKSDKNPTDNWIEIQARKGGFGRTLVSSRKVVHIIITGTPNDFKITQGTGEWGKNIAASALIPVIGWAGLVGLGLNARFIGKLWGYVQEQVLDLRDTGNEKGGKPSTQKLEDKTSESKNENSFCENCGNSLKPTTKFCGKCGNQV